jgi:hypothetical protein
MADRLPMSIALVPVRWGEFLGDMAAFEAHVPYTSEQ